MVDMPRDEEFEELLGMVDVEAASRLFEDILGDRNAAGNGSARRIGDYDIIQELGAGGGGTVLLGRSDGEPVAIKLLHRPLGDARAAARAWRELDVLEHIEIAGIPSVHDYGTYQGRLYMVSDHVDGVALDAFCVQHALSMRQRVALVVDLCEPLQALHDQGIIHRDIKPDNVLIREGAPPALIDFGLAAFLDADQKTSLTMEGVPVGSVEYMSPEQARGDIHEVTVRSDIYSLAATLCAVLVGRTPHPEGSNLMDCIRRVGFEPLTIDWRRMSPLPNPIKAILTKAMMFESRRRYASVAEFRDDLERWLAGQPVHAQEPSWWRSVLLSMRRRPRRWTVVTAALLVVFGALGTAVNARVQRLSELEARVQMLDAVRSVSLRMTASLGEGRYAEANRLLGILEPYYESVLEIPDDELRGMAFTYLDPDDDLPARLDATRARLIAFACEAILGPDGSEVAPADVVTQVARSVLGLDPDEDAAQLAEIRAVIEAN